MLKSEDMSGRGKGGKGLGKGDAKRHRKYFAITFREYQTFKQSL